MNEKAFKSKHIFCIIISASTSLLVYCNYYNYKFQLYTSINFSYHISELNYIYINQLL